MSKHMETQNTKAKLGILMICPFFRPNVGGVETHLNDLCEYLKKRGHRVFVVTYQPLMTDMKAENLKNPRTWRCTEFLGLGIIYFINLNDTHLSNFYIWHQHCLPTPYSS